MNNNNNVKNTGDIKLKYRKSCEMQERVHKKVLVTLTTYQY